MKLEISLKENKTKVILIRGEITSKEEVAILLRELNEEQVETYKISFFHANMVPDSIVERLIYLYKNDLCLISVYKKYLYSYLYSLGIKGKYVGNKSLNKSHELGKVIEEFQEEDIRNFLLKVYEVYGYDYTGYQIQSIMRRVNISMIKSSMHSFKEFQRLVLEDATMFEQLFLDFSINTTEFFRDPEVFTALRENILPKLDAFNHIKIWCVGCSIGKEPYSLAIMLHELGLLHKTQIYATDINPYVIEEGKNGLFSKRDLEKEILNYREAKGEQDLLHYFEEEEEFIKVKSFLKEKILFFSHSLISSGSLNEFTLILCRNVLIYFTPELQGKVLENFYNSLDKEGFLVLGKSEGLMLNGGDKYFKEYLDKEKIFTVK